MNRRIILIVLLSIAPLLCSAQKWSVATNAADWLAFGTVNANASVAAARHLTVNAEARYNPWTFNANDPSTQLQYRHQTYALGVRWWPWYVYSGWWMGFQGQYQEYNRGGIVSRETEEGDAFGLVVSGGYTMMLHEHLNLEFGAALWGGYTLYTAYSCPKCGRVTDSGSKWFILPSSIIASLVWVF